MTQSCCWSYSRPVSFIFIHRPSCHWSPLKTIPVDPGMQRWPVLDLIFEIGLAQCIMNRSASRKMFKWLSLVNSDFKFGLSLVNEAWEQWTEFWTVKVKFCQWSIVFSHKWSPIGSIQLGRPRHILTSYTWTGLRQFWGEGPFFKS